MKIPDDDLLVFKPEPLESLKARFGAAIETEIDLNNRILGTLLLKRSNIFDFEDGWRVIASRDVDKQNGTSVEYLHFSFAPGTDELLKEIREGRVTCEQVDFVKRCEELSGREDLREPFVRATQAAHFFFRL